MYEKDKDEGERKVNNYKKVDRYTKYSINCLFRILVDFTRCEREISEGIMKFCFREIRITRDSPQLRHLQSYFSYTLRFLLQVCTYFDSSVTSVITARKYYLYFESEKL